MRKAILTFSFILISGLTVSMVYAQGGGGLGPDSQWLGPESSTGNIYRPGNVAIGTSIFTDGVDTYKLSVDGKVRATSVKVYNSWADFVFEKEYDLPTLEEVAAYIQKHGHLKDIPSAAEVAADGINLGEMNKLLLQKIEELTLYVLALNSRVQELEEKK